MFEKIGTRAKSVILILSVILSQIPINLTTSSNFSENLQANLFLNFMRRSREQLKRTLTMYISIQILKLRLTTLQSILCVAVSVTHRHN